ncbi:pyridoxamine 5'-phosphate oxidase family protein [Paremcibacter congregatus]|uniref:NimA n=1 Tax=Paremcibacter congregatus TaxID=2043170 RepID=A0A2G4YWL7_9PROT|nr:pyridoxamine 5'-phosphate oxidase family protein [Paremcibacter congregatus]PHZ86650.1 NimA [Paremcibacter congregatus]QDE26451.1 pyridoxamine 5'-phosphate oxidase family protein [Paremcibacter congregatus]
MARGYDLATRPAAQQRRGQLKQDDAWISDLIQRLPLGHFDSRWDDQPFVHPMTYVYNVEKHCIYMHGSTVGRRRANTERHEKMCFCASEMGQLLPSNQALHFSAQYRSVVAFGEVRHVTEEAEQKAALYALIDKYFSPMALGKEYSPIRPEDLKRTTVFALDITSWSGKENWKERTDMDDRGWPELAAHWFEDDAFALSRGQAKPKT